MKSRYYFLLLLLVAYLLGLGCGDDDVPQVPTLEGDLVLASQADVDEAGRKGHIEITGSLIINDSANWQQSPITDLSALATITSISGDLRVRRTLELTNLQGLHNLQAIGGDLRLIDNVGLEEINALSNVTQYAEPEIYVHDNRNLLSIRGLQGVELASRLNVHSNMRLPNLDGLQNLRGVTEVLFFSRYQESTGLDGLSGLTFTGDLEIFGGGLDNLRALSALDSVGGRLGLRFFENLSSLDDLNNLSYVNHLFLEDLVNLSSLSGLGNLRTVAGDITIQRCDLLTDLSGLENVTQAAEIAIRDNDNLSSFNGLNNLERAAWLEVSTNPNLEEVSSLSKLQIVFDNLVFWNNPKLRSLQGLEGLTSVRRLTIAGSEVLNNLDALQNITTLGDFDIVNNPSLTILTPFQALEKIDRFTADGNAALTDFCGIANVDIRVNYWVLDNAFNPSQEDLVNGNCRQ